jgi:hypothetical protein
MKRSFFVLLLFLSAQLFSQTYLNVLYSDNSKKTIDLTQLSKITFSETNICYTLTNSSVVTDGMSSISNITFGSSNGGSPLPVELVSFIAAVYKNTITLSWSTATEVNNYGFEIERASTELGMKWKTIGFVQGHGNSNSPKNYSFTDSSPLSGKEQYRLKQIDFNGKYEYSDVVEVVMQAPANFLLKQNFPNPFNPSTTIRYQIPVVDALSPASEWMPVAEVHVTLKVYDVLGREVVPLVNENKKAGSYEAMFDASRLASGVYICKMSSANYSNYIKMLMIK